ncbi:hypothetical protein GCM10011369_07580 [Neiella marina]|uniref:Uncharacterized protein n=1 Tax=Neiella marina TaxID=508461 RepID=A0A8J2U324_9GAMM|nr:hypothetical protein [Neiella marina]GGA68413.1 hypothetical protein GCM10011369_07580 [Neiella marina]
MEITLSSALNYAVLLIASITVYVALTRLWPGQKPRPADRRKAIGYGFVGAGLMLMGLGEFFQPDSSIWFYVALPIICVGASFTRKVNG